MLRLDVSHYPLSTAHVSCRYDLLTPVQSADDVTILAANVLWQKVNEF